MSNKGKRAKRTEKSIQKLQGKNVGKGALTSVEMLLFFCRFLHTDRCRMEPIVFYDGSSAFTMVYLPKDADESFRVFRYFLTSMKRHSGVHWAFDPKRA